MTAVRCPTRLRKAHACNNMHTAQSMLLDLNAAWRAITAPPRAFTIPPLPQSWRRVQICELDLCCLQQEMPLLHPKDALRHLPKGAANFALQIGRAVPVAKLATQSRPNDKQVYLDYELQHHLVEGRPRAVDFSKAPCRKIHTDGKVSISLWMQQNGLATSRLPIP
jgi:hypothetical protein